MLGHLTSALDDASPHQGRKIAAIYVLLFAFNAVVWFWAFVTLSAHPTLLGTALLAYVLGLRHAVDADHIAAIDNVVRKLMQEGKRPISAGLFFSLGHSLVVAIAVAVIVGTAFALQGRLHQQRQRSHPVWLCELAFFEQAQRAQQYEHDAQHCHRGDRWSRSRLRQGCYSQDCRGS